jgi:hypothetical protein
MSLPLLSLLWAATPPENSDEEERVLLFLLLGRWVLGWGEQKAFLWVSGYQHSISTRGGWFSVVSIVGPPFTIWWENNKALNAPDPLWIRGVFNILTLEDTVNRSQAQSS